MYRRHSDPGILVGRAQWLPVRLGEVLRRPESDGLRWLAGPEDDPREVIAVVLIETLSDIAQAGPGELGLLTAEASSLATGYRLDIALREAGERGMCGLVLAGVENVSPSAKRLATRTRVPLVGAERHRMSDLLLTLDRLLHDDAKTYLDRAAAAVHGLDEPNDESGLLADATRSLGVQLSVRPSRTTGTGDAPPPVEPVPIEAEGLPTEWLHAEAADEAVAIALPAVAAALARRRTAERRAMVAPTRSRAELVAEILIADANRSTEAAERARLFGVPVDGEHLVACIGFDRPTAATAEALVDRFAIDESVGQIALQYVSPLGPTWTMVRVLGSVALVWSRPHGGRRAVERTTEALRSALGRVEEAHGDLACFAGVGATHRGVEGLRASAAEATAAMESSRALGQRGRISVFDASGVRRLLLELLAAPSAHSAITAILQPLEKLAPDKREAAVRTLNAYLDAQGSYTAAGKALSLHPNAVLYRVRRLAEQLGTDLSDPEQRFALQVACRLRLISVEAGGVGSG